jgi:hypothetical protein
MVSGRRLCDRQQRAPQVPLVMIHLLQNNSSNLAFLEAYSDILATISVGVTRICSAFLASCIIIFPRPPALTTRMMTDTIVNLFRVPNLNSYICKSGGTSSCLHSGYSAAFLGLSRHRYKHPFLLLAEYCYIRLFQIAES